MLLRDGAPGSPSPGVEVWALTRASGMAFAAGMTTFPGGKVDAEDGDGPWPGLDAEQVAEVAARFSCDRPLARSLLVAAIRELFEETGVLFTSPPGDLLAQRGAIERGELAFSAVLDAHGLALDASGVLPWARWVTPEGEARRYDTRFFVAALPPGAQAQDLTTEASVAGWVPVRVALAEAAAGTRRLLPPT